MAALVSAANLLWNSCFAHSLECSQAGRIVLIHVNHKSDNVHCPPDPFTWRLPRAPQVIASPALFIVIWAASYLGGYLVLFAPGGIGVRDVVLTGGLIALGLANSADATLLALASRVWLTVLEILPGVLALLWSPLAPRAESRRARSGHRDA